MWTPKDVATWLALIALILAVPSNLFASWLYPRLRDWWAARSRKSLEKRIDELTAMLADTYQGRGISMTDEWVLICAEWLGSFIYWSVLLLAFLIVLLAAPLLRSARHPYVVALLIAALIASYRMIKIYTMWYINDIRHFFGPIAKKDIEVSIAELTAKLARKHKAE